jgi:hypothetical protein
VHLERRERPNIDTVREVFHEEKDRISDEPPPPPPTEEESSDADDEGGEES